VSLRRRRVLVLSRAYPNSATELLGLWVQRPVARLADRYETKVIAPVPWCPPLPGLPEYYTRFRRVPRRRWDGPVEVFHARFLVGLGFSLRRLEWRAYLRAVRPLVERVRREFPFELVHAYFSYPDGVVAARIGRRHGVPVIITEQAPWRPWMDESPVERRLAVEAMRESAFGIAISTSLRDSIVNFTGESERIRVIPNGVDTDVFTLPPNGLHAAPDQILFVGLIRAVKGVDVLVRALRLLADRGRKAKLVAIGNGYYRSYQRDQADVRRLIAELGMSDSVEFRSGQSQEALVRAMQESAVLVLPSRVESLGLVLAEALACGTPVVATRSGGPEDIVTDEVGVLVPTEDPVALADGIQHVLDNRSSYRPEALRSHVVVRFGLDTVTARIGELYEQAVNGVR